MSASDEAQRAFERGDFAEAGRFAREALGGSEKEREAGRSVVRRMAPDPVAIVLTAGAVLFFLLVLLLTLGAH